MELQLLTVGLIGVGCAAIVIFVLTERKSAGQVHGRKKKLSNRDNDL